MNSTLELVERYEAGRRLREHPRESESADQFTDSQIETLLDAIVYAATGGNATAIVRIRHVAEFAARIAQELDTILTPRYVRRVATIALSSAAPLSVLPALEAYRDAVNYFSSDRSEASLSAVDERTAQIIDAAIDFEACLQESHHYSSPGRAALSLMAADRKPTEAAMALQRLLTRPGKNAKHDSEESNREAPAPDDVAVSRQRR